jgi:hypothetical protein
MPIIRVAGERTIVSGETANARLNVHQMQASFSSILFHGGAEICWHLDLAAQARILSGNPWVT